MSHQSAVIFSQNKSVTSNQPTVLFSQNKSAPAERPGCELGNSPPLLLLQRRTGRDLGVPRSWARRSATASLGGPSGAHISVRNRRSVSPVGARRVELSADASDARQRAWWYLSPRPGTAGDPGPSLAVTRKYQAFLMMAFPMKITNSRPDT
jgi:hypothetical protein